MIAVWQRRVVTGGSESVRWTVSAGNGRSPDGAIGYNRSNLLILLDLVGQDGAVAVAAGGEFHGAYIGRGQVHSQMYLAPFAVANGA